MNTEVLKTIRKICITPFAILGVFMLLAAVFGVTFSFFGSESKTYGLAAGYWILMVACIYFWWLFVICLIGIIITSILLHKAKQKMTD